MLETMSAPFDGMEIARQRIAEEAEARTGFLDLGGLGLTALPPELFELRHLRTLNLGAGIRREDGSYHVAYRPWEDAAPRNDLAAQLASLRQLSDLVALSVSATPIDDLTPLAGFCALQSLDCSYTQVSDLTPLAGLTTLQSLYCSGTQVSDLTPLSGLAALQSLSCGSTQVSNLTPLSGLAALQSLYCSGTQVSDLTPLAGLAALRRLDCSNCVLGALPEAVRDLSSLQRLTLFHTRIPGVPAEALSQGYRDNCLAAVRAHFQDLQAGQATVIDVKLIVLGNGRVGKTQI